MSTSKTLTAHPAAELFPVLSGKEYESFKADIEKNGLLEAIWLCDGKILDGRNRYRACQELGIEPSFRTYKGDSPVAFAWSLNGQRRHLSQSQLAAIAAKMSPSLKDEAKTRMDKGTLSSIEDRGTSTGKAARIVGVGHATVERAARIQREDPELFAKIEAGEITVNKALKIIKERAKKATPKTSLARTDRIEQARQLAHDGNRSEQIAKKLGVSREAIYRYAKAGGFSLPDSKIKSVRINARRVISETVNGLAGYAIGLQTINGEIYDVSQTDAAAWLSSLNESIPPIQMLKRKLARIANGN